MEKLPLNPLNEGEMGVLLAMAGAGKTACLTHLAIGHMLGGDPVLHVCVDILPDRAKLWYQELLKNLLPSQPEGDISGLQHQFEPYRFIMSFMNQTFSPAKLEQAIENLKQQAKFNPSLLIVDGLDFERNGRDMFEQIKALAVRHSLRIWFSARTHRHIADVNERGIPYPANQMDDLFSSILMLETQGDAIRLKTLKQDKDFSLADSEVLLDPHTFMLKKRA
ncbi:MAG: hypothetical protein AAGU11_15665 [Syntrophobacteraceae bacterium]